MSGFSGVVRSGVARLVVASALVSGLLFGADGSTVLGQSPSTGVSAPVVQAPVPAPLSGGVSAKGYEAPVVPTLPNEVLPSLRAARRAKVPVPGKKLVDISKKVAASEPELVEFRSVGDAKKKKATDASSFEAEFLDTKALSKLGLAVAWRVRRADAKK